jgi:hypothetical protein
MERVNFWVKHLDEGECLVAVCQTITNGIGVAVMSCMVRDGKI